MNGQSPHRWWFTFKSAVFGLSSSLPPLVGEGGGLMCELVDIADQLSDHFDGKRYRESVGLPLTYHPSPRLTTFVFRSSEVRRLWFDMDPMEALINRVYFLIFLRELLMFWLSIIVLCFGGLFVWVVSCLVGDRPMLPQFQKVNRHPLVPITNQFP